MTKGTLTLVIGLQKTWSTTARTPVSGKLQSHHEGRQQPLGTGEIWISPADPYVRHSWNP